MKFSTIIDLIKLGLPALLDAIKNVAAKKNYTKEEINSKAQSELEAICQWKKSSDEDRKIAYGE